MSYNIRLKKLCKVTSFFNFCVIEEKIIRIGNRGTLAMK